MRVAAIFYKVTRGREHLTLLRDSRCERCAVHHLTNRFSLRQWTQRQLEAEWPRGVAIGGQDRRVEEQPVFRRHFARLKLQQTRRDVGRLHLKLIRADYDRMTLLGLRIEWTRAGETKRFALRFERAFVGRQQRVSARYWCVQLHHV